MSVSRPSIRAVSFEQTAGKIMYRWSVERDIWVSPTEVEEARAYLGRMGIPTTALPDGRFLLEGTEGTVEASRLILLSLRFLCARRPRLRA